MPLNICIHVTSAAALPTIFSQGLQPAVGSLSAQLEVLPRIYMFPSWETLMDANWLFEAWPHDSEPALLGVRVQGLLLETEVGFEYECQNPIEATRIFLLAEGESDWDKAEQLFYSHGGHRTWTK